MRSEGMAVLASGLTLFLAVMTVVFLVVELAHFINRRKEAENRGGKIQDDE